MPLTSLRVNAGAGVWRRREAASGETTMKLHWVAVRRAVLEKVARHPIVVVDAAQPDARSASESSGLRGWPRSRDG
jgi:hypothetical protein